MAYFLLINFIVVYLLKLSVAQLTSVPSNDWMIHAKWSGSNVEGSNDV